MAKATKTPSDYSITLTLSSREAEQLLAVTEMVGGGGTDSGILEINRALKDAGVEQGVFRATVRYFNKISEVNDLSSGQCIVDSHSVHRGLLWLEEYF